MQLEHKPGETMQVGWADQTAGVNLLRLGGQIPAGGVGIVCKALTFTSQLSYKSSIQSILKSRRDKLIAEEPEPGTSDVD